METIAVIDFETTGLSPVQGARATEVAAVLVRGGRIVDRYQSLMNSGVGIPPFIQSLTGITNAMIENAPPTAQVMREVAEFVGSRPLAAHNASFDRKFWDAELARVRVARRQEFVCSMLVARRIFPEAPNHKLRTLAEYARIPFSGRHHRALSDAEMAAKLILQMEMEMKRRFRLNNVPCELLHLLQRTSASAVDLCIERYRRRTRCCSSQSTA